MEKQEVPRQSPTSVGGSEPLWGLNHHSQLQPQASKCFLQRQGPGWDWAVVLPPLLTLPPYLRAP